MHSTPCCLARQASWTQFKLVTFLLALEDHLRDEFQQPMSLTDDRAMSQRNSPFRSLRSLATYVQSMLEPASTSAESPTGNAQ